MCFLYLASRINIRIQHENRLKHLFFNVNRFILFIFENGTQSKRTEGRGKPRKSLKKRRESIGTR